MRTTRHTSRAPDTQIAMVASFDTDKSSAPNDSSKLTSESEPVAISVSLTLQEESILAKCEQILCTGLQTFFEVGSALLQIRDRRLYRATHSTFEGYCQERWGLGRAYAWRVIGAAERVKLLPESVPKPANECQIRPFLKFKPDEFPRVWKKALKRATGGKMTPGLIHKLVTELSPTSQPRKRKISKRLINGAVPGQILILLHDAKQKLDTGQKEEVLSVLEEIESLLFGQQDTLQA